jgi:UDP-glucose 4-epimerase
MRVLVTGGAGYIGSVITDQLIERGHTVVVYDNLSKGHREAVASEAMFVNGDLLDEAALLTTFRAQNIEAVMHMAASSLVGESMARPETYYQNNVVASLNLLRAMVGAGVRTLVFSSTAAIYGEPERQPITETDAAAPSNTYGETKLAVERALHWYHGAHGIRYAALRYFNAAGATARRGERHDPETHLIPLVLLAARDPRARVTIFGNDYSTRDGTCVRDYVHVADLGHAHVSALDALAAREIEGEVFNLGCGAGYTVKEVIDAAERVTGRPIATQWGARRPGDPAVLVASAEKIRRVLGWTPAQGSLDDIVRSAWNWEVSQGQLAV